MRARVVARAMALTWGVLLSEAEEEEEVRRYTMEVAHGNVVALEHVNINVDVWTEAHERFFVDILGCPRDPRAAEVLNRTNEARLSTGRPPMSDLYWYNVGLQQFHLPIADHLDGETQTVRGEVVLVWPRHKIEALKERVVRDGGYAVETAACPEGWGFRFQGINDVRFLVEPTASSNYFGPALRLGEDGRDFLPGGPSEGLGIRALRFDVALGKSKPICRFYETIFDAETSIRNSRCVVHIGFVQSLEYVETERPVRAYDGHHVALYVNLHAFKLAYARAADIIFNNPRAPQFVYDTLDDVLKYGEFRFKNIVDVDALLVDDDKNDHDHTSRQSNVLFELEHEVRALSHPGFLLTHRLPPAPNDTDASPRHSCAPSSVLSPLVRREVSQVI